MRYYAIETYTPYCGEHFYHYLSVDANEELDDYMEVISEWVAGDALEWYYDTAEEDYPDFNDYLCECGYRVAEISYEEYRSEIL